MYARQTGATSEAFLKWATVSGCSFLELIFYGPFLWPSCNSDLPYLIHSAFLFISIVYLQGLCKFWIDISFSVKVQHSELGHYINWWHFGLLTFWTGMKGETLITLYFFILAVITLFFIPLYLLAVIELHKLVFNQTSSTWMFGFLVYIIFVLSLFLLVQQLSSFICIICPDVLNIYHGNGIRRT